ncbi:phage tail protein [Endozoicomonas lisbonensis]|uniref:Phage tail collar domain-containing protein n=1 Tax=Endozoicomonas lisbonensis TaxID=3120522 RepID=A0ABV2SFH5_9GAMM
MAVTDDFYIENQPGAPTRSEMNTIFAALATCNAGSNEPPNPQAGMLWLDTSASPWMLNRRNAQNTGWIEFYDTSNQPDKAAVGLPLVDNFSSTSSLTDGSPSKFSTAKAAKDLEDKKLDKSAVAADSAQLGGIDAGSYALQTGDYSGLRARGTTQADVGLPNVANYTASSSITLNNNKSYALSSAVYTLNQNKLGKTEQAADSQKLGGKLPAAFAQSVHDHGASDLPTGTTSAKGILQILDSVTSTSKGYAASPNSVRTAYNRGDEAYTLATTANNTANAAMPKSGSDLSGSLNYTPDTGVIIKLDGKPVLERHTKNGGISFGADDAVIIGSGESRAQTAANVSHSSEVLHLSSDNEVVVRTNLQGGWGDRKEFYYEKDGGFKPANAAKTRQNLDVPTKGAGRIVGEIVEFGFDEVPAGFFIMNNTRVIGGMLEPAYQELRDKCLGKFIHQDGDDFIVQDMPHFRRGKGSSGRVVGVYEDDAIREITGGWPSYDPIDKTPANGAFRNTYGSYVQSGSGPNQGWEQWVNFMASRVVPTAPENRPKSHTVLVGLYHGVGV